MTYLDEGYTVRHLCLGNGFENYSYAAKDIQFKIRRGIIISVHATHDGNTNSMVDLEVAGAVAAAIAVFICYLDVQRPHYRCVVWAWIRLV